MQILIKYLKNFLIYHKFLQNLHKNVIIKRNLEITGGRDMKIVEKLKKKKKTVIVVIIILIIVLNINRNIQQAQKAMEEAQNKIETETIEKRTIAKSVSATGTVTTENSKDIIASLTGSKIATVNVTEGQKIAIGDVICTFDMASVQNNLSDAKSTANISNAQSNLGIESARRNLEDATKNRDTQIVNAQKEVANAQEALNNVQNQFNETNRMLTQKQAELTALDTTYAETQNALTLTPEDSALAEKLTALNAQKEQLTAEITALQSALPELQQTATQLKSVLDTAINALNTTTATVDSNISSLQDNLRNAELAAQSSNIAQKGQVQNYEEQLKKGIVTSTVSGTVTSVKAKVGDLYTGNTIATINQIDAFIVEAEINEYDISDIQTGMKAIIKTDATKEEELEGQVIYTSISPTENVLSSGTTSTQTTYKIKIALKQQNERLRLGMNAKISIILDSRENVWTVPYEAVQKKDDGTQYIQILKENTEETEDLTVRVGIEGTYYVEIIANELRDGMQVVLPKKDAGTTIEELMQMQGASVGI